MASSNKSPLGCICIVLIPSSMALYIHIQLTTAVAMTLHLISCHILTQTQPLILKYYIACGVRLDTDRNKHGQPSGTCRPVVKGSTINTDTHMILSSIHFISESNPCSPNPCLNDGYCIEEGSDFSCVCNGTATGYTGPTCGAAIVHFPPIPPVTDGLKIPLTLFTDAEDFNEKLNIAIKKPNTAALRKVLSVMSGQVTQGSVPGAIGIVTITLPRNTATVTYEPRQRNVFVAGIPTQQEAVSYFDQFNLVRGLLRPGCCDAGLQSSCHGTHTVSLLSPCQWNTTRNEVKRTDGLVFAKVTRLSLPTSLSGLKYREKPYLNKWKKSFP